MRQTKLPADLWPEAIDHQIWLKARTPTRARKGKIPWERTEGLQPDLSREAIWGSRVYASFPPEQRQVQAATKHTKLHNNRGWLGYFVGPENEATLRVYDPDTHTVKRVAYATVDMDTGPDDPQARDDLNTTLPRPPAANLAEQHDYDSDKSEDSAEEDIITPGAHQLFCGENETALVSYQNNARKRHRARKREAKTQLSSDDSSNEEEVSMSETSLYFDGRKSFGQIHTNYQLSADDDNDDDGDNHKNPETKDSAGQLSDEFLLSDEDTYFPDAKRLRPKRTRWSKDDDQKLIDLRNSGAKQKAIQAHFSNRSLKSVQARMRRLKDDPRSTYEQSVQDRHDLIIQLIAEGKPYHEIADRTQMTVSVLRDYIYHRGLRSLQNRPLHEKCANCRLLDDKCVAPDGKACTRCMRHGTDSCKYRSEDGTTTIAYINIGNYPNRSDIYDEDDSRCIACCRACATCIRPNDDGPCNYCVKKMNEESY